ncbi:MAG TPA: adenylosuccinate lyase [Candidatus Micrarchaeia archaeon]|nr:adenylosuccinate lyase [Candidatus Micrarchaeia archaeon]
MIDRYAPAELRAIWSEGERLASWLRVEVAACEGMAAAGQVPGADLELIRGARSPDPARVGELEAEQGHDVAAFVSAVQETLGPAGRHLHRGLTSQDVVDTALALQLGRAAQVLQAEADRLLAALGALARTHVRTPMAGRTHGVHAEPVSFGFVLANHHDEIRRSRDRLRRAAEEVAVGRLRGAVGTSATVAPEVEERALALLGLDPAPITTQVVARDRHAAFVCAVAVLGATLERLALTIRHLQRTEVGEALEPFGERQKGSSAMPHKRNPVRSEQVCGLARLLRGHAIAALEDVALWHERDISHSSVERVILPDATMALGHMLRTLTEVVGGLEVHPERMLANLEQEGGRVYSQRVLLALIDRGCLREDAYRLVQRLASPDGASSFREVAGRDPELLRLLGPEAIAGCFDLERAMGGVAEALARVGLDTGPAAPGGAA